MSEFKPGDRVQVRNSDRNEWREATYKGLTGQAKFKYLAQYDDQIYPFAFKEIQPISTQ